MSLIDITGERFGRLTVIKLACHGSRKTPAKWLCKCDCGNVIEVSRQRLISGHTKSCGCLRSDIMRANIHNPTKHGLRYTRIYKIYADMKSRCNNPNRKNYKDYGGRGIKICSEWSKFENFYKWAMENGYSDDLTIDRLDVNGDYEPSNCRWVTYTTQERNKRNNIYITINGETKTLMEWCEIYNVPYSRTRTRYVLGYPLDLVFSKECFRNGRKSPKTNPR